MSPEDQAKYWAAIRPAMIAAGLGDEQTIPQQPTPDHLRQIEELGLGDEAPRRPKITDREWMTVDGKKTLVQFDEQGNAYDIHGAPIKSQNVAPDDSTTLSGGNSDYSRYLERAARSMGKQSAAELTTAEEDDLRQTFYATARAPQRAGAGRRAPNPRGSGAIPQGVERYIIDMRNRGYLQEDAVREMLSPEVWANMQRDHPTMTAERARAAITRLIPEEGAAPVSGAPSGARGGGPGATTVPADRVLSLAELRAAAKRLGIDEATARREYEKRGFVIR